MWERTLQDLIRGLRARRNSSQAELDGFLQDVMQEIRQELKGGDMELKSEGVVKMCYLMMLYPLSPPPSFAFHVVEVMSSQRYHLKQLGYLAAPMTFCSDTEEVVLTVNNIRKDLLSPHAQLPPLALGGLSDILTPALARDVHLDVISLLSHSKPHVRKRAVLALYRIFERCPEALQTAFPRLKERLEDEDPGVVVATVNVITELSRKSNPKNFLPLAPQLFEILTTSSNNWMLIKIVKLFATLTPIEPRLVRRLLPPITNLISTTPAISLLYECVRTCIVGGMLDPNTEAGNALARVCIEKLSGFLTDEDQNLKYIALAAMVKIVPTHPHLVADYQDDILHSLDDPDLSIRMRALELASRMADRDNLRPIVTQLLSHLVPTSKAAAALPSAATALARSAGASLPAPSNSGVDPAISSPAYRLEIVKRILRITRHDTYANIMDFEWYISVLVDLTYVSNVNVGGDIMDVILDVVARVRSIRGYAVGLLSRLVSDDHFLDNANEEGACVEVLGAAAWVCGEYSSELRDPSRFTLDLLRLETSRLPSWIRAQYVSAAMKTLGTWAASMVQDWSRKQLTTLRDTLTKVVEALKQDEVTNDWEVQERVHEFLQLLQFINAELAVHQAPASPSEMPDMSNEGFASSTLAYPKSLYLLEPLFNAYEMTPVGYKAQESVPLPPGLDLNTVLVPPSLYTDLNDDEWDLSEREDLDLGQGGGAGMEELRRVIREGQLKEKERKKKPKIKANGEVETEEERQKRKAAKRARQEKQKGNPYYLGEKPDGEDDIDGIPIVKIELNENEHPVPSQSRRPPEKRPEILRSGEMPGGSVAISEQKKKKRTPKSALDFEITDASATRAPPPAKFAEYVPDDEPKEADRAGEVTMEPVIPDVQVVKVKKKKKKRVEGVVAE